MVQRDVLLPFDLLACYLFPYVSTQVCFWVHSRMGRSHGGGGFISWRNAAEAVSCLSVIVTSQRMTMRKDKLAVTYSRTVCGIHSYWQFLSYFVSHLSDISDLQVYVTRRAATDLWELHQILVCEADDNAAWQITDYSVLALLSQNALFRSQKGAPWGDICTPDELCLLKCSFQQIIVDKEGIFRYFTVQVI